MTAAHGVQRVGVTANSFNSLSLSPPLVLWSIRKDSASYPVFASAEHFAVNILAADQIELSNRFARSSDDRFDGVALELADCGTPMLLHCAARFRCAMHQVIDGGDHWLLIGRVVAFEDFGRAPLVYHQGAYSSLLAHPRDTHAQQDGAPAAGDGRLQESLFYLMTQAVRQYGGTRLITSRVSWHRGFIPTKRVCCWRCWIARWIPEHYWR
ncbi:flavin reductase family protein [Xanthomonas cassavae]|nr:flavin reductase family protein [Xanthomonas cassavae]